jgi:hypothetical protein
MADDKFLDISDLPESIQNQSPSPCGGSSVLSRTCREAPCAASAGSGRRQQRASRRNSQHRTCNPPSDALQDRPRETWRSPRPPRTAARATPPPSRRALAGRTVVIRRLSLSSRGVTRGMQGLLRSAGVRRSSFRLRREWLRRHACDRGRSSSLVLPLS